MLKSENSVDTIKTTLRIPKDLIKKFKHLATDKETTVTMLVIEAMQAYLEIQNFQFDKSFSNIDSLKKEELVKSMRLATDREKVTSMIEEMNNYLDYLIPKFDKPLHFRNLDFSRMLEDLTMGKDTRVATVKGAMKEYLQRRET